MMLAYRSTNAKQFNERFGHGTGGNGDCSKIAKF